MYNVSFTKNGLESPKKDALSTIHKNNAFYYIFTATLMIGIPIRPLEKCSEPLMFLKKAWCPALMLLKTFCIIISFHHVSEMLPDYEFILSFYIFNGICFLMTLDMMRKRRQLYTLAQDLTNLSNRINPTEHRIGSRHIILQLVVTIIAVGVLLSFIVPYFFFLQWQSYLSVVQVPFGQLDAYVPIYLWVILLSTVFIHGMNIVTCLITLLICYSSYLTMSNIIDAYRDNFNKLVVSRFNLPFLRSCIIYFQEISHLVKRLDNAVSAMSFLLFGIFITTFFLTISLYFSNSTELDYVLPRVYICIRIVGISIMFLMLTISGAGIMLSADRLRGQIMTTSESIGKYSKDSSVFRLFLVLANHARDTELQVTGYEMFMIERGLIMTFCGMIVTYGFLLYEFNKIHSNIKNKRME